MLGPPHNHYYPYNHLHVSHTQVTMSHSNSLVQVNSQPLFQIHSMLVLIKHTILIHVKLVSQILLMSVLAYLVSCHLIGVIPSLYPWVLNVILSTVLVGTIALCEHVTLRSSNCVVEC